MMADEKPATPYAQAADIYWSAGWHGILPLPAAKKKNPPAGFTGSGGRYPSYPDIAVWVEDHASGNIALRMPPNVIGLDVDAYGDKDGARTLYLAESMHGPLPATWRSTSRDDGVSGIRFYRVPEGLAWPGEIGAATEIIQRTHRYAIVWPSVHPEGRTYRWIDPNGLVSTRIPDPDELPALPESWVQAYTGGVEAIEVARHDVKHDDALAWIASQAHASAAPCVRMQRVIDGASVDIGDGSAHNPARDYALRITRLTEEQHSGGIAALGAARAAFFKDATDPQRVLLGKQQRTEPEAAYEWAELLASAVGLVIANPTGMDTCDCYGNLTGAIVASPSPSPAQPTSGTETAPAATPEPQPADDPMATLRARLKDGEEFILNVPSEVPTIWGDADNALWVDGEALMIAGPPGVGKSTLTGQVLRGLLGLDEEVLGQPVRPAQKVLYLAMDRPAQIRRALARAFHHVEATVLRERVEFWEGPPPGDMAKHPDVLTALAELAGADVVIIDSLKDAAIGLTDDEVGAAYNRARQKLLASGVQLLELHHMVKRGVGGAKPTELADVYGSAWLTAGVGSVVLLWGAAGDPVVEFRHLKQPVSEVGPHRLMHDHDTGTTTIEQEFSLLGVLASAGVDGMTAKHLAAIKFETDDPSRSQREKVRRQLDKLIVDGRVERVEGDARSGRGGTPEPRYMLVENPPDSQSRASHAAPSGEASHGASHASHGNDVFAGQRVTGQSRASHAPGPVTHAPSPNGEGVHGPQDFATANKPVQATTNLTFIACQGCGDEYLDSLIEASSGYCRECAR